MFKIIYLKLTFIYVLIIMLISVTFSIAIYNISKKELGRGLGPQNRVLQNLPRGEINHYFEEQILESSKRLKLNLLYYNLIILLISFIGSYYLARRTLKPVEEAMEIQSRFTADASHELRTPLTVMKTEIEVALRDPKINIKNAKQLLKSNLEETEKLKNLTENLLTLAQKDKNKNKFQKLNLEDIIARAFERVEKQAEKKKIKFLNKLQEIKILGDEGSLIQLFVILLNNAIKYSPKGSTINITMRQFKKQTQIEIKDHGIGIKASDIPYIFNRFYRADLSRTKEQVAGYGLGLSIAKQIVDHHHGKISVESTNGKGSKFIVQF